MPSWKLLPYRLQEIAKGHINTEQQRRELNLPLLNFSASAQCFLLYSLPWYIEAGS